MSSNGSWCVISLRYTPPWSRLGTQVDHHATLDLPIHCCMLGPPNLMFVGLQQTPLTSIHYSYIYHNPHTISPHSPHVFFQRQLFSPHVWPQITGEHPIATWATRLWGSLEKGRRQQRGTAATKTVGKPWKILQILDLSREKWDSYFDISCFISMSFMFFNKNGLGDWWVYDLCRSYYVVYVMTTLCWRWWESQWPRKFGIDRGQVWFLWGKVFIKENRKLSRKRVLNHRKPGTQPMKPWIGV